MYIKLKIDMISNFMFSKIFRITQCDDIGHIAHRPQQTISSNHQKWYVCIEKRNDMNKEIIHGFDCKGYDNLSDAEKEQMKLCQHLDAGLRSRIVDVCKWMPRFFHPFIISYKLKSLYWKNEIDICPFEIIKDKTKRM